jgi:uncharacterized membrane protein
VLPVLVAVVLLANGMGAGVLMGTVLGGVPLLLALPPGRYVHAHAFFATRYDPFMPSCLLATVVADAALVWAADASATKALAGIAGALAAVTVTISITKNVPINKWVRTLDPERLPADWPGVDPRARWKRWNNVRTACTGVALLCNVFAIACLV